MKRRRPDGIYCHSPQPKKRCWLGADGRRKCTGGHNLSKEWKGFTKEFNVRCDGKCQGPHFSFIHQPAYFKFPQ